MHVRPVYLAISCLLATFLAGPTNASPDAVKSCLDCHGSDGMGKSDPVAPVIAGMPAGHIEEAIYAYIDGARHCVNEPKMCEAVAALSETQVTEAASYYAGQERGPTREPFDADLAAKGAAVHAEHCAKCHLPPDDPDVGEAVGIPLHGQRSEYIRYALQTYLRGDREALVPRMTESLRSLQPGELDALVQYYASYRPAD